MLDVASTDDAAGSYEAIPRRGRPGYDAATVLRRAIELFNRQGYEGASMGDLAGELGLSKSAIYHHVPSKESLLAAALDEALDGALGRDRWRRGPARLPVRTNDSAWPCAARSRCSSTTSRR